MWGLMPPCAPMRCDAITQPHFKQLFALKGNYDEVCESLGTCARIPSPPVRPCDSQCA